MEFFKNCFLISGVCVVLVFSSCKKIQNDNLINGVWTLNSVLLDSSLQNYLNYALPQFANGNNCCHYEIDFEKNDKAFGYYLTNDSSYLVLGMWNLPEYNKIYIHLDNFIDGTFDIDKKTMHHFVMSTDANRVKQYAVNYPSSGDTVKCVLDLTRN